MSALKAPPPPLRGSHSTICYSHSFKQCAAKPDISPECAALCTKAWASTMDCRAVLRLGPETARRCAVPPLQRPWRSRLPEITGPSRHPGRWQNPEHLGAGPWRGAHDRGDHEGTPLPMGPSLLLVDCHAVHMAQGSPFALGLVDGPHLGGLICTGRVCTDRLRDGWQHADVAHQRWWVVCSMLKQQGA